MNLFGSTPFVNLNRYSKDGITDLNELSFNDNCIIKGDNQEVLNSLLCEFKSKIKLICIDPPYNTGGNKFNYNDNIDHDDWLSFMEKRLAVSHKLLTEDGIIYIHCDDRENAHLKFLCDKIFGRDQFITNLIWRKKAGGANDSNDIAVEHEYILAYRKKEDGIYKIPLDEKTLSSYKYKDVKLKTHGKYKIKDLNDSSLSDSSGLHYDVECPDGSLLEASKHQWKCNQNTFNQRLKENRIIFKQVKSKWKVYYKIYLNEQRSILQKDDNGKPIPRGRNLSSILYDVALNKDGSRDLKQLFNGDKPFSYPKPVKLIKLLIQSASKPGDIILDFFAGSGTTGQAVLELNKNNISRNFILIEKMDFIHYVTIPRIIKSLKLYQSEETFIYCEFPSTK